MDFRSNITGTTIDRECKFDFYEPLDLN